MEMRHPPELSKNHLLGDLVVTATHGRSPIRRFRSDLDTDHTACDIMVTAQLGVGNRSVPTAPAEPTD